MIADCSNVESLSLNVLMERTHITQLTLEALQDDLIDITVYL